MSDVPSVIRAACRAEFYRALPVVVGILQDPDASDADKLKAFNELGRFGLGAADSASVTLNVGDGARVAVVAMPALGETVDPQVFAAQGVTDPASHNVHYVNPQSSEETNPLGDKGLAPAEGDATGGA